MRLSPGTNALGIIKAMDDPVVPAAHTPNENSSRTFRASLEDFEKSVRGEELAVAADRRMRSRKAGIAANFGRGSILGVDEKIVDLDEMAGIGMPAGMAPIVALKKKA